TNENFYLVYELFQAKPLSELIEGATTVKEDIFAFGLLSLQLITKDGRTACAVEERQDISLHHTLDLYLPMFREKGNRVHPSYGQQIQEN
ncbi:LRR receptor-like serine/threonine-protein kinase FLS2, partial [Bienertia sinuspersici]